MAFCATQNRFPLKFCNVADESTCEIMNNAVTKTPKFTAMLSILGASFIIYRFMFTPRKDRKTHDRLMLGMSIMNFWGSIGFFIGQWTFPTIDPSDPSSSSFCNWQGWLLQINSAVFWYNSILATSFVLRIRFGWHDDKMERFEPLLHVIAWLYPVLTSFIGLGLHIYGAAGPWCWINPHYDWARWAFFFAGLWFCMIYSACCMISIVFLVKQSDDRTLALRDGKEAARQSATGKKMSKRVQRVARQATLYIATFLLTWVFGSANRIQNAVALTEGINCSVFPLMWLHAFFVPLQGFGNYLVYIYPRIWDAKKKDRLVARQRALTNAPRTRTEVLLAIGSNAVIVMFGTGAILTEGEVTKDSGGKSSIPRNSEKASHSRLSVMVEESKQTTASSSASTRMSASASTQVADAPANL